MTINNVTGYLDYFRQLAVSHKDLLHDPTSETGDAAPGSRHFAKISVDEVVMGLRSKVGYPLMVVELYEVIASAQIIYNIDLPGKGAFMIIHHPANESFAAEEFCYEKSEAIVYDILKKIWQDHYGPGLDRCDIPFKEFGFNNLQIIPVGPVFDKEFGYRVEFDFQFQQTIDITEPPAAGTFI